MYFSDEQEEMSISPLSILARISFLKRRIFTLLIGACCPKTSMCCYFAMSKSWRSNALSSLRFILLRYWSLDFGCFRLMCPPRLWALLKTSSHILHFMFLSAASSSSFTPDFLKCPVFFPDPLTSGVWALTVDASVACSDCGVFCLLFLTRGRGGESSPSVTVS